MVTTCNTQYDNAITYLSGTWGISNNAVFDRLVLQAAQRMSGAPTNQSITAGAVANTIPAFTTGRVGAGGD